MRISKCSGCGCEVETAVTIRNVVCVKCLGTYYARTSFEEDVPTVPRAIKPLVPEERERVKR